jgi:hypothetical protein
VNGNQNVGQSRSNELRIRVAPAVTQSWVEQAGGGGRLFGVAKGWRGGGGGEKRWVRSVQGKQGVAALQRCRLAAGPWPVRVGER